MTASSRNKRPRRSEPGVAGHRRFVAEQRPPQDEPWVWLTRSMLESAAWRALPLRAQKIVFRVALENMHHAGKANGDLAVTYDHFQAYGIRRGSIPDAIAEAEALGLIDVVERGRPAWDISRTPSRYGLTWLPRCDSTPASNRWRRIGSMAEAKKILKQTAFARGHLRASRRAVQDRRLTGLHEKRRQKNKMQGPGSVPKLDPGSVPKLDPGSVPMKSESQQISGSGAGTTFYISGYAAALRKHHHTRPLSHAPASGKQASKPFYVSRPLAGQSFESVEESDSSEQESRRAFLRDKTNGAHARAKRELGKRCPATVDDLKAAVAKFELPASSGGGE